MNEQKQQSTAPACSCEEALPQVGIVGLGLIGGSIARSLSLHGCRLTGLDPDPAVLEQALQDGVLSRSRLLPLDSEDDQAWQVLEDCQVVFLCTPAATIPRFVQQIRPHTQALLTDVASVKKPVLEQITDKRFIGGHPMAGSEKQGYAHSSAALLENAVYVLCIPDQTSITVHEIRQFEHLIRLTGATPFELDARRHDRAVAAISHLPHIAASALSMLAALQADDALSRLAAGGFRDITRIASSNPRLWSGISMESRQELLPLLDTYIDLLKQFREDLSGFQENNLHRFFFQAAQYRGSLPVDGRGALMAQSALNVYINDRPGVLGQVTTLLGEHHINISNIRIREFRTYEGGCLQLLLPDSAQAAQAAWLLKEAGYECD